MVTPFLEHDFDMSISYGGCALILASLGMALGSAVSGVILQRQLVNSFTAMAFGALVVSVGLLLAFPPRQITSWYKQAPYTVLPGVFLTGIGNPLITLAGLKAMFSLQVLNQILFELYFLYLNCMLLYKN